MKNLVIALAFIPQLVFSQKPVIASEIQPTVEFIKECKTSPVNYVMGLFETYDIVVLGERDHRDITQYELINELISNKAFIDKIGYIFTEVGSYYMTERINMTLKGSYNNEKAFDIELAKTLFEMDYMPIWDKTNYTQLMKSIYQVNKTLPDTLKLNVVPTDISFSWNQAKTMTNEEFKLFFKQWKYKDIIMANNAINELYRIFDGKGTRKKAVIILNSPHSCRYYKTNRDYDFFTYQIIADRFPGRVANVAINWAVTNDNGYESLSNEGKIDAAFAACANKSVGFNLAGTPIGEYFFDYANIRPLEPTKFSDVYHGFIFYKPVNEWVACIGVPNLGEIDCREELARRCNVWDGTNDTSEEFKDDILLYYSNLRSFPITTSFPEEGIIERQISKWYKFSKK